MEVPAQLIGQGLGAHAARSREGQRLVLGGLQRLGSIVQQRRQRPTHP